MSAAAAKRPTEIDARIGANLADLRKRAGLSQVELRERLARSGMALSQAQLSHYELGKHKVPASLLAVAAPLLNCSPGDFFPS